MPAAALAARTPAAEAAAPVPAAIAGLQKTITEKRSETKESEEVKVLKTIKTRKWRGEIREQKVKKPKLRRGVSDEKTKK